LAVSLLAWGMFRVSRAPILVNPEAKRVATPLGIVAARCNIDNPEKSLSGNVFAVFFNKCAPHLLWSAKKVGAFF
jgi:hypothetical protein